MRFGFILCIARETRPCERAHDAVFSHVTENATNVAILDKGHAAAPFWAPTSLGRPKKGRQDEQSRDPKKGRQGRDKGSFWEFYTEAALLKLVPGSGKYACV